MTGGVNGHTAQTFVETSPRSWAEADIKSLLTTGEVSLDEAKGDKKGPVSIAAGGVGALGGGAEARRPARRAESRKRASSSSATPTSPPTRASAFRATATCS